MESSDGKRVVPFANGTGHMMWLERNCFECARGWPDGECEIADEISLGSIVGDVDAKAWERMGRESGRCTEFEAKG